MGKSILGVDNFSKAHTVVAAGADFVLSIDDASLEACVRNIINHRKAQGG